jgi:hypothetical protein
LDAGYTPKLVRIARLFTAVALNPDPRDREAERLGLEHERGRKSGLLRADEDPEACMGEEPRQVELLDVLEVDQDDLLFHYEWAPSAFSAFIKDILSREGWKSHLSL